MRHYIRRLRARFYQHVVASLKPSSSQSQSLKGFFKLLKQVLVMNVKSMYVFWRSPDIGTTGTGHDRLEDLFSQHGVGAKLSDTLSLRDVAA